MPITGQTDPTTPATVTIPLRYRAALKAAGYNGPWTVNETSLPGILGMLDEGGEGGGGDNQDDSTQDLIDALSGLTGSSGSSSGGSGGYAGMSPEQKANLRASYMDLLRSWGIRVTKNLEKLMNQGINGEWSTVNFKQHLVQTIEYKQQFPGILSQDGMNEATYNARFQSYQALSRKYGFNFNRQQFALLLKNDVPEQEWAIRMDFQDRVTRNAPFFSTLQDVARARGIIKPKERLSEKELYEVMTHRGNPAIERLMEESTIRYQVENAGLTIGKKGDVSRKQVLNVIKSLETQGYEVEDFQTTANKFAALADKVKTLIPAAKQIGYGITKGDLFVLEFGGKGQNEIKRHVESILATVEAEKQPRINPILVEDDSGHSKLLGGGIKRPTGL